MDRMGKSKGLTRLRLILRLVLTAAQLIVWAPTASKGQPTPAGSFRPQFLWKIDESVSFKLQTLNP